MADIPFSLGITFFCSFFATRVAMSLHKIMSRVHKGRGSTIMD